MPYWAIGSCDIWGSELGQIQGKAKEAKTLGFLTCTVSFQSPGNSYFALFPSRGFAESYKLQVSQILGPARQLFPFLRHSILSPLSHFCAQERGPVWPGRAEMSPEQGLIPDGRPGCNHLP